MWNRKKLKRLTEAEIRAKLKLGPSSFDKVNKRATKRTYFGDMLITIEGPNDPAQSIADQQKDSRDMADFFEWFGRSLREVQEKDGR